ncbi:MAG TPA: hypothetical protein VGX68_07390 [Thermoanaerobaculia bacterium]|jgi:hypothetical protein|nr:hypothetical protein [Thermoanaerobaculia bacterium]
MWKALAASVLLMLVAPPAYPAEPDPGEPIPSRFQELLYVLKMCGGINPPEYEECGDAGIEAMLSDLWPLAGRWAVHQLVKHPQASTEELTGAMQALDRGLEVSSLRLASGPAAAYVVALTAARYGTLLAVARQPDGSFQVVWNLHEFAVTHSAVPVEIAYWGYDGSGFGVAPLGGTVHALPPSRSGHVRFYLDAVSHPEAGGTFAAQISVWEWDGHEPRSVFIKSYARSLGTIGDTSLKGDRLELHTKEELKRFFTCGMCPDPEAVWTLRITPDGVEDMGRRYLTPPELQATDELVDRIVRHQDVSKLAAPGVERQFWKVLKDYGIETVAEDDRFDLGTWEVGQRGGRSVLHLRPIDFPPLDFTFEQREGRGYYATGLEVAEPMSVRRTPTNWWPSPRGAPQRGESTSFLERRLSP